MLDWLKTKSLTIPLADKDVNQRDLLYIADKGISVILLENNWILSIEASSSTSRYIP